LISLCVEYGDYWRLNNVLKCLIEFISKHSGSDFPDALSVDLPTSSMVSFFGILPNFTTASGRR
jgi:hypothetical protein